MAKLDLRDPNTQIAGAIVFASLAIGYVFFVSNMLPFGYQNKSTVITQLEQDYEKVSADLMKAKQSASRLPKVQAELEAIAKTWDDAKKLLPEAKQMPELLTQVTVAGQRSGVDFVLFEPKPGQPKDIYVENPIAVTVQGGYHDVGSFLGRISNLPRIVNVRSVNLKSVPNPVDPDLPGLVEADMQMSAYTLLSESERASMQAQQEAAAANPKSKGAAGAAALKNSGAQAKGAANAH
jgi:type IV pilus assembly protein PilO